MVCGVFKRSQQTVSKASQHWYQDKYQHVLVQRNILALLALVALVAASVSALAVLKLAPLKTVEPYLLQVNEKTGVTQRVEPLVRDDIKEIEAIDKYFTAMYIHAREEYNYVLFRRNYGIVSQMSSPNVSGVYRQQVSTNNPASPQVIFKDLGQRTVKINSLNYIITPPERGKKDAANDYKILQARITTTDIIPNKADVEQQWVVTITFQYVTFEYNFEQRLINPLGYAVISYQIQREIN